MKPSASWTVTYWSSTSQCPNRRNSWKVIMKLSGYPSPVLKFKMYWRSYKAYINYPTCGDAAGVSE